MKKLSVLAAIIFAVASCVSTKTKEASADNDGHLCGAYTDYRALTAEDSLLYVSVIEPFLATKEVCGQDGCQIPEPWSSLDGVMPSEVRTQVVAGVNYQFNCSVALVTVFQPLPGRGDPSVTDISFR